MYAQQTTIRVPAAKMGELRAMVESHYLPVVSRRPGFRYAYLMEQVDDETAAELITLWDTHAAAESFTRTGSLAASIQALVSSIPGVAMAAAPIAIEVAMSVAVFGIGRVLAGKAAPRVSNRRRCRAHPGSRDRRSGGNRYRHCPGSRGSR